MTPEQNQKTVELLHRHIAKMDKLKEDFPYNSKESFEKLTGLPGDAVPFLTAYLSNKPSPGREELVVREEKHDSSALVFLLFDAIYLAAGLGYMHGLEEGEKQATDDAKSASESAS